MDREPWEAVFIGSLSLSELLCFREEAVYSALSRGIPVYLYPPGLPESPGNRYLAGKLSSARRELRALGVRFLEDGQKQVITAKEARNLKDRGLMPDAGAVLTPLAKEILEGSD